MHKESRPHFEQNNINADGSDAVIDGKVRVHKTHLEKSYWADFYEQNEFNEGSSFSEFLINEPNLPSVIIDIGCGEGRDSFAFTRAGKTVMGLDRSEIGVEHANRKAASQSLGDQLLFSVCDVSDEASVHKAFDKARETASNESVCFYMRFFLHSIPEEAQDNLMRAISTSAMPGDVFAAEFRTDKDENQDHTFGDSHYRRYQSADDFSKRLGDEYGWDIASEVESKGLSPYKDEDPVLYRVLAVRG